MRETLFTFFGLFTIFCAVCVAFARNAVYSAFSLVLCFFGLAALYVLWESTFIAMIQILIYTGAIVVLFVFVVMLLDLGRNSGPSTVGWFSALVSGVAAWFFALFLLRTLNQSKMFPVAMGAEHIDFRTISKLLFTDYLWPFEVLSVFLLAMIIAIYVLARPTKSGEEF